MHSNSLCSSRISPLTYLIVPQKVIQVLVLMLTVLMAIGNCTYSNCQTASIYAVSAMPLTLCLLYSCPQPTSPASLRCLLSYSCCSARQAAPQQDLQSRSLFRRSRCLATLRTVGGENGSQQRCSAGRKRLPAGWHRSRSAEVGRGCGELGARCRFSFLVGTVSRGWCRAVRGRGGDYLRTE